MHAAAQITKSSSSGHRPDDPGCLELPHWLGRFCLLDKIGQQPELKEYLMKSKLNVLFAAGVLSLGMGSAFAADLTAGEVRKVDTEQGKVTLKHETIKNLDMPPMTMVFRAEKPELLKDLKPGDKVRFAAASVGGSMVVTEIQPEK
jgi:Cu(I)/Ag(I) efflux system protein CusF